MFKPNADNKLLDYRLVLEVQNNGVMIDKLMLNQVVSNLLSNAIKFTDQGSVQLLMRELPGGTVAGRGRYAIQVSDTGRGLTARQCQEIFEPFVQADPQAHRALGTGLGLSICASLSKLLNAQLIVDSQPGLGSRFTLTFEVDQVEVSEAATLPLGGSQADQKLKVLVVEDHAPNRLVLCKQLEYLGHEVVPCEDGETALEQWLNAEPPFDLTITDCGMPRMDGYELAEAMREVERQRAVRMHTIFDLTANAQAEITQRCLDAGMNRCLFKPVSIETLATLMAELAQASKRRALASASSASELDKLRLLSPESHAPLVISLIQTHQEDARQLQDCLQSGDVARLIKIAHKVHGGAQLAGDAALMDACRTLESLDEQTAPQRYADAVSRLLTCLFDLERRLLQDLP
ncbi:hypothetical protein AO262_24350 [Pseudomonas fluorescens ABAC62]|nr:hypothetical protein AO262_24350 [Pseudomonas fluorescens ABAC62]